MNKIVSLVVVATLALVGCVGETTEPEPSQQPDEPNPEAVQPADPPADQQQQVPSVEPGKPKPASNCRTCEVMM